eukprot:6041850-Prymnesium_polylepis.1
MAVYVAPHSDCLWPPERGHLSVDIEKCAPGFVWHFVSDGAMLIGGSCWGLEQIRHCITAPNGDSFWDLETSSHHTVNDCVGAVSEAFSSRCAGRTSGLRLDASERSSLSHTGCDKDAR